MTTTLLERTPLWEYNADHDLTQWYGNVELCGRYAIGQWFCIELTTGHVVWTGADHPATAIHDVDTKRGVIVATQTNSGGPCTWDSGLYGISIETGELLWTGPSNDGVSLFRLLVSFLPGLRIDWVGSPHALVDGELFTESGHVIDVTTGASLRKIPEADLPPRTDDASPAHRLYRDGELSLRGGGSLHVAADEDGFAVARTGPGAWHFELAEHKRFVEGNYFSWRLRGRSLVMIVSDAPGDTGHSELWELDLPSGEVKAKTRLTTRRGAVCRLEDVDDGHLLIRRERTLWCFAD
jgi:outer membrane protein assembly factor BamB